MRALLNKAWKILAIAALCCTVMSCELMQREFDRIGDIDPPENRGALIIRFTTAVPAATLTPPISMEIDSFDVYGTGPDPATDYFEYLGIKELELSESSLTPGEWTIQVDARNLDDPNDPNSDGTIIARGQATVTIVPNITTTVQIEIKPIDDPSSTGTLDLTVEWTTGKIPGTVTIQYSLKAAGSTDERPMVFVKNPNNKSFELEPTLDLPPGYYTLTLQLLDSGAPFWGIAEAVRIISGQTTSQVYQAP